jgi:hypothetical protein
MQMLGLPDQRSSAEQYAANGTIGLRSDVSQWRRLRGGSSVTHLLGAVAGAEIVSQVFAPNEGDPFFSRQTPALLKSNSAGSELLRDLWSPRPEVTALIRILDRWNIDDKSAAKILGYDTPEAVVDLRSGAAGLRLRDTKDRARLFLAIYEGVFSLYKNPESEGQFVRKPLPDLGERTLLGVMTEGSMANLMLAKEFVDYLNGL